jgi:hypothetical protein
MLNTLTCEHMCYVHTLQALDQLDILVMESRAIKLFKHCDLDGSGNIGQSEFEVRTLCKYL